MMSPLSIFNFDTLDLRGFRPWAAVGGFCLLLIVEFGAARSEWLWSAVERSPSGVVDALEQRVLAQSPNPRVVVLGSSRTRDAIDPSVLAEELNLPADRVLNISLTAGTPHDSLVMYRRNRAKFADADLLILGFDDWNLRASTTPSERFRRFANLEERFTYFSGEERLSLIVGYFWRTLDAKMPLGRFIKVSLLRSNRDVQIDVDGRINWRDVNVADRDDGHEFAEIMYRTPSARDPFLRPVDDLLHMASEDQTKVILYRPPLRESFLERRQQLAPRADEQFERALSVLRRSPAVLGDLTDVEPAGYVLEPSDFFDYGHLRPSGAEKATHALAEWIERNGGLP